MSFRGWGMEDTHLGAKLVGIGLYVIPDPGLTVYHVTKPLPEQEMKTKQQELKENMRTYNQLLSEPLRLWTEPDWKTTITMAIKDKVQFMRYL